MSAEKTPKEQMAAMLNAALGWEMRAEALYYHYAAYVRGIHRLHLKPYFEAEGAESVLHANTVREQIVKLGGVAVTERDATEIAHTTDYRIMLAEGHKTEMRAASGYRAFLDLPGIDAELYDAIEQIYFQEERSIEEMSQLLES